MVPRKQIKLTISQWATLQYVWEKCGITVYGTKKKYPPGSKSLQKLVKLKLIEYDLDESYRLKAKHYRCTAEGKEILKNSNGKGTIAMYEFGWQGK